MTPSLQSVDHSASFSVGTFSSDKSNLLFKKPSRRPSRPVGPNFGRERLRPDGAGSSEGELRGVRGRGLRVKVSEEEGED